MYLDGYSMCVYRIMDTWVSSKLHGHFFFLTRLVLEIVLSIIVGLSLI